MTTVKSLLKKGPIKDSSRPNLICLAGILLFPFQITLTRCSYFHREILMDFLKGKSPQWIREPFPKLDNAELNVELFRLLALKFKEIYVLNP